MAGGGTAALPNAPCLRPHQTAAQGSAVTLCEDPALEEPRHAHWLPTLQCGGVGEDARRVCWQRLESLVLSAEALVSVPCRVTRSSPGRVGVRLASRGCLASILTATLSRSAGRRDCKAEASPCPHGPGLAGDFEPYPSCAFFSAHAPQFAHVLRTAHDCWCFHGCARPSLMVASKRNPVVPIFLRPAAGGMSTLRGSPYSGHFTGRASRGMCPGHRLPPHPVAHPGFICI